MPAVGGQTGELLAGSLGLAGAAAVLALLFRGDGPASDWVKRLACLVVVLGLGLALSAAPDSSAAPGSDAASGSEAARANGLRETQRQSAMMLPAMGLGILASCWVVLAPTHNERLLGIVGVTLANMVIAYFLIGLDGAMYAVFLAAGLGWLGRNEAGELRAIAACDEGQAVIPNERRPRGVDVVNSVVACLAILWPVLQVDWSIQPGAVLAAQADEQPFFEMIWNEEAGITIAAASLACSFVWQIVASLKQQDGLNNNLTT
jgi:hypothetical protein